MVGPPRLVIVRRSPVHGKGLCANDAFTAGECMLEYKGEIPVWQYALRRQQLEGITGHTSFFRSVRW
ncbi:hypothetical protein GGD68_008503 [Paraburkholderia fungorum]|jgi:hypothetical protein|nr:hypothetical protein [Paraburkholderia fungorum]